MCNQCGVFALGVEEASPYPIFRICKHCRIRSVAFGVGDSGEVETTDEDENPSDYIVDAHYSYPNLPKNFSEFDLS